MDDEAIQCKMNCCLKETIWALAKAMIYSNWSTILLLSQGLVEDLSMVCKHARITWVIYELADELELLAQDKFTLFEGFQHIKL